MSALGSLPQGGYISDCETHHRKSGLATTTPEPETLDIKLRELGEVAKERSRENLISAHESGTIKGNNVVMRDGCLPLARKAASGPGGSSKKLKKVQRARNGAKPGMPELHCRLSRLLALWFPLAPGVVRSTISRWKLYFKPISLSR